MTSPARLARTVEEMRFAAGLVPCAGCGLREIGALEIDGAGTRWTCRGPCPRCGVSRTFEFETAGDPRVPAVEFDEIGPGVSKLLTAAQLLLAMQENASGIPDDAAGLTPRQRARVAARLMRAIAAASELLKMLPPPSQPQSDDPRLQRANVEKEYKRLAMLSARRYAPPNTLDVATLDAHRAWLERGAHGDDGRLRIEGMRLVGERYGSWPLSFVRIARSDLSDVTMSFTLLNEADLEDVVFTRANLYGTSFAKSAVRGGSWTLASLDRASFDGADVRDTDFSRSTLDRSTWFGARVSGARFDGVRFGNARFDGALFAQCSFRGASLAKYMTEPTPTSAGARFVGCDFTDTDWTDRDLQQTTFVGCIFDGARGRPAATGGLVVTDSALDAAAFLAQLGR